jgi:hypothetical protein
VKPPDPHDEALGAPHGRLEAEPALAKVENCFATSSDPHRGQTTPALPAPMRWSISNFSPQLRHVYS